MFWHYLCAQPAALYTRMHAEYGIGYTCWLDIVKIVNNNSCQCCYRSSGAIKRQILYRYGIERWSMKSVIRCFSLRRTKESYHVISEDLTEVVWKASVAEAYRRNRAVWRPVYAKACASRKNRDAMASAASLGSLNLISLLLSLTCLQALRKRLTRDDWIVNLTSRSWIWTHTWLSPEAWAKSRAAKNGCWDLQSLLRDMPEADTLLICTMRMRCCVTTWSYTAVIMIRALN